MDADAITKEIQKLFSSEVLEVKLVRMEMRAERAPHRGSMTPRQVIKVEFFAHLLKGGVVKGDLELESVMLSGLSKQEKIKDIIQKKKNKIDPENFAEELKKI